MSCTQYLSFLVSHWCELSECDGYKIGDLIKYSWVCCGFAWWYRKIMHSQVETSVIISTVYCFQEKIVIAIADSSFDQCQFIHNQDLKIRAENPISELALNFLNQHRTATESAPVFWFFGCETLLKSNPVSLNLRPVIQLYLRQLSLLLGSCFFLT